MIVIAVMVTAMTTAIVMFIGAVVVVMVGLVVEW